MPGINLQTPFTPQFNAPLDERTEVANKAARNSLAKKYTKMHVVTLDDKKEWVLKSTANLTTSNTDADWEEAGTGGTGGLSLASPLTGYTPESTQSQITASTPVLSGFSILEKKTDDSLARIGNLPSLTTDSKFNLVTAINELADRVKNKVTVIKPSGVIFTYSSYAVAEASASSGDTIELIGFFPRVVVTKSVTLVGSATILELELVYLQPVARDIKIKNLNLIGRIVACPSTGPNPHKILFDGINLGEFSYFEHFALLTNGFAAGVLPTDITIENVYMRKTSPYISTKSVIGSGNIGFQERNENVASNWTIKNCYFESVFSVPFTGYATPRTKIILKGNTTLVFPADKPIQDLHDVNSQVAYPTADVIIDERVVPSAVNDPNAVKLTGNQTISNGLKTFTDGIKFGDGTVQITASTGGSGGVTQTYVDDADTALRNTTGLLVNLTTSIKTSIVNAINEVKGITNSILGDLSFFKGLGNFSSIPNGVVLSGEYNWVKPSAYASVILGGTDNELDAGFGIIGASQASKNLLNPAVAMFGFTNTTLPAAIPPGIVAPNLTLYTENQKLWDGVSTQTVATYKKIGFNDSGAITINGVQAVVRFKNGYAHPTIYAAGDIVKVGGIYYIQPVQYNSTPTFTPSDWNQLSGAGVENKSTTVLTFKTDAEYAPQSAFTFDTSAPIVGVVVCAYTTLNAPSSAVPIPAGFILDGGTHDATKRNQYLFKYGADLLFHYTIIPY